ncbi:MAG: TetR/AcrR family transcriptional regulator [Saprospiraceae bacterium]|nr:TetR/AcrR family transcriptional regulator [Saprospiraceae bacterium]MCB9322345.1 TetR/AcrR family transcriptional regulator [Lewinellaceae bacterium]
MENNVVSKSDLTRQMIVEKSATLFNLQGFSGTSMKDIMDATGLSKGGLYGNFKTKEDIALAAYDQAVEMVWEEVKKRTKVIDHSLDKLKAVVYFYKERILDPPVEGGCPIQNTTIEADDGNPVLRKKVQQTVDNWRANIVANLEKGMKRGEVRLDVNAADFAIQFIGILEGGIMLSRLYKELHCFDVIARQLIKLIDDLKA